jgi:hypothetical protein
MDGRLLEVSRQIIKLNVSPHFLRFFGIARQTAHANG